MNMPLWTLIPAIFLLTFIYLEMGNAGYWNYNINDWINGNLLISLSIGFIYLTKKILKKDWDL